MPGVLPYKSAGNFPRLAANDRLGQGALLLHEHLAARFAADPPRWSNRVPCKAPECLGRCDTGHRKYNSRSYGCKLFYANARLVSTASADGGIMCGNRCRNHSRNAEKAADAAFIGGDHRSADGRGCSLDSDEWKNSLKPHCVLNFWCIARKTML